MNSSDSGLDETDQSVSSADVRSVQSVELPDLPGAFEAWGSPRALVSLLHSYFDVAVRSVWPLVCIQWQAGQPRLMVAGLIPLIVMGAPSIDSTVDRRAIKVAVRGGILVNVASSARLTLSLDRRAALVCANVELVGYYPRFGQRAMVRRMYAASQARLHVSVGRRFLRELHHAWASGPTPRTQR